MKKYLLIAMLTLPLSLFAQSETEVKSQTTFEKFTSTIGHIVKFKDYSLPDVTGKEGSGLLAVYYIVHAQVRQVMVGDDTSLFLRLSYKPDQTTPTRYAFIAYEDVKEIDKALKELVDQGSVDTTGDANYLENKFKTQDFFEIGYYISKHVSKKGEESFTKKWYIDLDNRFTSSTAFFATPNELVTLFESAISKMESLK